MMKKLILILCILQGVLLSLRAQGEQQNIAYTDNNVRFTVISDGTLRLEYARGLGDVYKRQVIHRLKLGCLIRRKGIN